MCQDGVGAGGGQGLSYTVQAQDPRMKSRLFKFEFGSKIHGNVFKVQSQIAEL